MKVWLFCTMKDEAEILPYWLRHYQTVADKIIVYDHHSTDGTPDILRAAGVDVRSYDPVEMDDGHWAEFLSTQYREARGQADWVIVVDADEFIYNSVGVRYLLEKYLADGKNFAKVTGYTMISSWFPAGSGQIYDYCQTGTPDPLYSKPCIFTPDLDVRFVPGKHKAFFSQPVLSSPPELKFLHYRYFGRDWLRKRNERNAKHLSERAPAQGWGFHVQPGNTGRYSQQWYEAQPIERIVYDNPR